MPSWQKIARRIRVPLGFVAGESVHEFIAGRKRTRSGWADHPRARLGPREKKRRADHQRALSVHAKPALSGVDRARRWVRDCFTQLDRGRNCAGTAGGDLSARYSGRRAVPAVTVP